MIIRQVKKEDYGNIYNFIKNAFKSAFVSDGTEENFVEELRNIENYIPNLEFILENEEYNENSNENSIFNIIGHIMFTKIAIDLSNSNKRHIDETNNYANGNHEKNIGEIQNNNEFLLLAPVSILEGYRNQGIGTNFIKKTLSIVKEMGFKAVFVVGDRNYYKRFGFISTRTLNIYGNKELPLELIDNVMVKEIVPNFLENIEGIIHIF